MTAIYALLLFALGMIIGLLILISGRLSTLIAIARQNRRQLDELTLGKGVNR